MFFSTKRLRSNIFWRSSFMRKKSNLKNWGYSFGHQILCGPRMYYQSTRSQPEFYICYSPAHGASFVLRLENALKRSFTTVLIWSGASNAARFPQKWLLKTEKHFSWNFESSAILFIVLGALSNMIFRKKNYWLI